MTGARITVADLDDAEVLAIYVPLPQRAGALGALIGLIGGRWPDAVITDDHEILVPAIGPAAAAVATGRDGLEAWRANVDGLEAIAADAITSAHLTPYDLDRMSAEVSALSARLGAAARTRRAGL